MPAVVLAQTINSISPVLGNVGTLVTLGGTNLNLVSSVAVNGTACILLDKSSTSLRLLVMPGASTGTISTTGGTPAMSATAFTVTSTSLGTAQQGPKLIGTGTVGPAYQGTSVALSADGGTLAVGGFFDNNGTGATWVFTRSGMGWAQQGPKLVGTGAMGAASQGTSVALSADGSTLALGGITDNSGAGATWVFTRSGTSWAQQGPKLIGTGAVRTGYQGSSVALSADGGTLAVGGQGDNDFAGAAWVFTRSGTIWAQQGPKLVGTGAVGSAYQGVSVALSADGGTLAAGGDSDNSRAGATWVFTRSGTSWAQQGPKLIGTGAVRAGQGTSVALSADGSTLAAGGDIDNNFAGATWVFTRSGMDWAQQGPKLVGTGTMGNAYQGSSVALSADGGTLAAGGNSDNSSAGATWVFTRSGTSWAQQGPKLVGTGAVGPAYQGVSVALSADGSTLAVGGTDNNFGAGATWVFSTVSTPLAQIASASLQASPNFFPNPIAEQLTITGGASSGTLYLLDGLGRTLLTLPYRQGQPISLASLAPGCYWLRLNQGVARPLVKR